MDYEKKARELAIWATGGVSHFSGSGVEVQDAWANAFAKFGRECAAEAYSHASEFAWTESETAKYLRAKAASLRRKP